MISLKTQEDNLHVLLTSEDPTLYLQNLYIQLFILFRNSSYFICPDCEGGLHIHSSFNRSLSLPCGSVTIKMYRVYCPHCGKSHRVVLDFYVPHFQVNIHDVQIIFDSITQDSPVNTEEFSTYAAPHTILTLARLIKEAARSFLLSEIQVFSDLFSAYKLKNCFKRLLFHTVRIFQPDPAFGSVSPL